MNQKLETDWSTATIGGVGTTETEARSDALKNIREQFANWKITETKIERAETPVGVVWNATVSIRNQKPSLD